MTDQTESESEHAGLLSKLDAFTRDEGYNINKYVALTMRDAAAAIRALEAAEWARRVAEQEQPESASEHAELLADLGFYTENDYRNPLQTRPATQAVIRNAIDAIRALEAKVRDHEQTMQAMAARWETTIADRDRLAGEVERIRVQFDEAIARIKDMLEEDDGQAFKEAGKFLLRIKGRDDES